MFLTVNGKEIIFSTFFWLSSSLKYPHCWCINLQWGRQAINTTALKTVELQISFNISFKERPPYVGISLTDSGLNGNERPIGFIKDPVSLNEFTLCNRSEIDSGANSYFWIALGKI